MECDVCVKTGRYPVINKFGTTLFDIRCPNCNGTCEVHPICPDCGADLRGAHAADCVSKNES